MTRCDNKPIELVVFDFGGVCTPSHGELVGRAEVTATIPVRPGCVALVADLAEESIKTAVLSNEISPSWMETVPLLGAVDHVINCADNKIYKPDRRAFQRCSLVASVAPAATLVVDDELDNVRVARSLGMMSEHFDIDDPGASWARVRRWVWP